MTGEAIQNFDDLPPTLREKLRYAPANLRADEVYARWAFFGEDDATAKIDGWIRRHRPDYKSDWDR